MSVYNYSTTAHVNVFSGNMCQIGIAACRDTGIEYDYKGEFAQNRYSCNKPFSCSFLQDPVCGTDGKTYSQSSILQSDHFKPVVVYNVGVCVVRVCI